MIEHEIVVDLQGNSIKVPYYIIEGQTTGPHLVLSGGMHGDEVNGILLIDEFIDWVEKYHIEEKLKGKITVIPILNPTGFQKMSRYVPEDSKDINRCFLISTPTSITELLAEKLMIEIFSKCNFGIDFHDAGQKSILLPHVRVHKDDPEKTLLLAQVFGTKLIVERDGKEKMLAVALKQRFGIPMITVEIGGGNKRYDSFIEEGLTGIKNILIYFGMTEGKIILPDKQFYLNSRYGVYAQKAVYVELNIGLGDFVHHKQRLGTAYYPGLRKTKDLIAPMCGLLFNKTQKNQIATQDLIFSVLETKECHVKISTDDNFEELPDIKLKKIRM